MANIADKVRSVFEEAAKSVPRVHGAGAEKARPVATGLKAILDQPKKRLQEKLKKAG